MKIQIQQYLHYCLLKNSGLSQVVAEKSLTEKKFTNKQTNIITEKAKAIYPYIHLCTSYQGYNESAEGRIMTIEIVS